MPCGHGSFSFYVLLAACAAGGKAGPVMGLRPSEAPSALPPDDPAGLVVYPNSHGLALKGFPHPTIPRGLRGFRSGSFLATLGDLPTRRAMPACAFALHEGQRASRWLWKVSGMAAGCWGKARCDEGSEPWGWPLRCVSNALLTLGLTWRCSKGNETGSVL